MTARTHRRSGVPHGSLRGTADRPSAQLAHFLLGLLQPVRHVDLALHRRRGGEMLLRLLALARAPVELAETEVAVGDEGAHPEVLSEGERVTVVALSAFRRI